VVLSARSQERLHAYLKSLLAFVEHPDKEGMSATHFADLAYTSQVGRTAFEHRVAIVAADVQDFVHKATKYLQRGMSADAGILVGRRSAEGLSDLLEGDEGSGVAPHAPGRRRRAEQAPVLAWPDLADPWSRSDCGHACFLADKN